jgi:1-acyl-sn-glycerol-3-phosphate acyltransferase
MIIWLRSLLFLLGMLIISPIFAILVILLVPFSNIARSRMASYWAHCALFWLKFTCNLGFQVRGRENIPNHPSIVLSKHQSAWETIALQVVFPPQVYVMKRELLYIPILGWAWMALSSIAIDRSAGREALKKLVSHGKDRLARALHLAPAPNITLAAHGWPRTRKQQWCRLRTMPVYFGVKMRLANCQALLL